MMAHQDIGKNRISVVNPSLVLQEDPKSSCEHAVMALAGTMALLAWRRLYWGWLLDESCLWHL